MNYTKFLLGIILYLTMVSLQSQTVTYPVNNTYTTNTEIFPFNQNDNSYGLSINGAIHLNTDSSMVRVVLTDINMNEYLIFEAIKLICPSGDSILVNASDETCLLNNVFLRSVKIEVINATLNLSNLVSDKSFKDNLLSLRNAMLEAKLLSKINLINSQLTTRKLSWRAGVSATARMSYAEKKSLFGDNNLPNLYGFEYYVGGYVSFTGDNTPKEVVTGIVDNFDWRNRHGSDKPNTPYYNPTGYGWITPRLKTMLGWHCWAFAPVYSLEAMINLYYNQQINMNLSEEDIVICSGGSSGGGLNPTDPCAPGYPTTVISYMTNSGIVDEPCFPYRDCHNVPIPTCNLKCNNPAEKFKINGMQVIYGAGSELLFKTKLIQNGPMPLEIHTWGHVVSVVGYGVVKEGDLIIYGDVYPISTDIRVPHNSPDIGKPYYICKECWGGFGANGDSPFYNVIIDVNNPNFTEAFSMLNPITNLANNTRTVACNDFDGDGFYNWGIGPKPNTCPNCPNQEDCDDNNAFLGPYDTQYGCNLLCNNFIYNNTPKEINVDETWNNDLYLNQDIIVKTGKTLTIRCKVGFVTEAKIIVESGAKLIVENSGFLSSTLCNDHWQGIEVKGSPMSPLTPQYQGYVELKSGAVIENAIVGVHCVLNEYYPSAKAPASYASGGIIIADEATFRNNQTSVYIEPYIQNYNYYSTINACTFEYSKILDPSIEKTVKYIKLCNVKNVNIYKNIFNGNSSAFDKRGIGIEALDATFNLNPSGDDPNHNKFINLAYGIRCCNTNSIANPDISITNFTDCWRAIYLSGVTNANLLLNNIIYKSQSTDPNNKAYGIYLDNCNNYHVEGNILDASNINNKPENGIIINNSGTSNNKIYRNSFSHIQVPVNAQNINRLPNGSTGLQLLCNNIIDCTVNDIVLTYDNKNPNLQYPYLCGIKMNQGDYTSPQKVPAANLFTRGGKTYKNYANSTPNIVYYSTYSNDFINYQNHDHYLIPRNSDNITNKNTFINWTATSWENNDCPNNTGIQFGKGKNNEGIEDLKKQINLLQPKIDSSNNVLFQKMDHGNTTALINRIVTATPANYQILYNDLRCYSPYLSEEVLLAIIQKQGFPINMLVNLMLVNSHVAKTPALMDALLQVQPPISNGQLRQIKNKINVFSNMETDRIKISNLISQRDFVYNTVETYYAHDSLPASFDSLGLILQQDPRITAKYNLVYYFLEKKDSVNADQLIYNIPLQYALDSYSLLEYNKHKQLYEMKRQLQREGKAFNMMDEDQQVLLINTISNPSASLSEMNDLNALRQVIEPENVQISEIGGKNLIPIYIEPILDPLINTEKNMELDESEDMFMEGLMDKVLMEQNSLLLYPNPAADEVNILYNIADDAGNTVIKINDLTGRSVCAYIVKNSDNLVKINTQSFKKGIYYVILVVNNKNAKVEKLVIQ